MGGNRRIKRAIKYISATFTAPFEASLSSMKLSMIYAGTIGHTTLWKSSVGKLLTTSKPK